MSEPQSNTTFDRALELVRFLRKNCPWDAAQTPQSLLPYLLEESHEVADAVSNGDERNLESELGDLLLNIAFQVVLADERGAFNAEEVVSHLEAKMRRRHPHLYGDGPPRGDGPYQAMVEARGNAYLDVDFPDLTRIVRATIEP